MLTLTATDPDGMQCEDTVRVIVDDTTAPGILGGDSDLYCIWPPNHWLACFTTSDLAPEVSDNCGRAVEWWFTGCASDEPEDGLGDGHSRPDCVVDSDGTSFCVRAERSGPRPEGRRYAVSVAARDACGNQSGSAVIGNVLVPHDGDPRTRECLRPMLPAALREPSPLSPVVALPAGSRAIRAR
jgi:hypothetical protein